MSAATILRLAAQQLHKLADQLLGAMGTDPAAGIVNVDEVVELQEIWKSIRAKEGDWEKLSDREREVVRDAEAEESANG